MEVSKILPSMRIVLVLSLAITSLMAVAFAGSALAQDAGTIEDPAATDPVATDPATTDPATTDATDPAVNDDPVRVFRDGLNTNPANTSPGESFDRGKTCGPTITFGVDVYWFANNASGTWPVALSVNQGNGTDETSYTTNVPATFNPASPVNVPLSGTVTQQPPPVDPSQPHADVTVTHNLPAPGLTEVTYFYRVHIDGDTAGSHNHYYSVTVDDIADCAPSNGCTLTAGYWKNHTGLGPQADVVTALLPKLLGISGGAKTVTVNSVQQAVDILSRAGDSSNGINKLYAQLLAAKLSIAYTGADPSAIASTIAYADAFLATKNAADWNGLNKQTKGKVLSWAETLDNYNNGLIGPGHCNS
jgi:hypothetical protein